MTQRQEAVMDQLTHVGEKLDELNARLEADIQDVRITSLPREHFKRRFRQMVAVAVCATLFGLVLEHVTITKCFLTANQTGWSESTCSVMFPGYREARKQSQKNLTEFQNLISQIPVNDARIDSLQQQIDQLEAKTK